jgi:RNA polymerase sigma-70 factor (ECF subfamily)
LGSPEVTEDSTTLVEKIITGDTDAEAQMIKRYQRGLKAILSRKVNAEDRDLLDDIIQETWRLVIEKVRANELNDKQKLQAFIITIGKYQVLMHYRKHQTKTFVSDDDLDLYADASAEPQKQLEKHKVSKMVRGMISKLKKPRDREILTRYYLLEDSKDAISEAHDLNDLHFNRVKHRALQRFKALWQSTAGTDEFTPSRKQNKK